MIIRFTVHNTTMNCFNLATGIFVNVFFFFIQELFTDLIIEDPHAKVVVEEVEKVEGEARANNRKGKLIFFYEWEITLKWKGQQFEILLNQMTQKLVSALLF